MADAKNDPKKQTLQKTLTKHGKKALGYLTSPFTLGVVVTVGTVSLSFDYYAKRAELSKDDRSIAFFIQQMHEKTIDWRLTDRGQKQGSERVAILAIDERSIEQEGRWPWPRDKMAKLIDRTIGYGAKVVGFDIIFSEEDNNSSIPTLRRLKRQLASEQKSSVDLEALFDAEIARSNSDRAFADVIKKNADHLVMGSYFDATQMLNPQSELCIDALFGRTYEARYWKREQSPLMVQDEALKRLGWPKQITENLNGYFTLLEVSKAADWFDHHKEVTPKLQVEFGEIGLQELPPETYPGLATLWLNNDVESTKALLEQVNPKLASEEGARLLFSRFGAAFTKKEAASLSGEVREAGGRYCAERFFTERDELLSLDKHKQMFGDTPEANEQFQSLSWATVWQSIQPSNPDAAKEPLENAIARFKEQALVNAVNNVDRWWISIPLLGDQTKHTGYFNAVQDTDGSIRRSLLTVRRGNEYMPSLAFKTFLLDNKYQAKVTIDVEKQRRGLNPRKILKGLEVVDEGGKHVMNVPVDAEGHLMINYSGARNMFPYVSAADILSDDPDMTIEVQDFNSVTGRGHPREMKVNKKEFLKDKLLIAGATAMGVFDLRVTPFDENFPGVETHANVLSNLLVEHARQTARGPASVSAPGFLKAHPLEERYMWVVLLGIGLVLSALLTYFGSVAGLGITAVGVGAVYGIDKYVLFRTGNVTATIFPMFLIAADFVSLTFYKYFGEERKKRELKGTFEKYVSPAIVAEVLSDPSNIELGGKKVELTVMFSDVRGFTTISEKLDPRELSNLLNSYLTPMTDLVFKNKGTLDKYMGDAIMSFWGAPIHFPDHAKHGCRCALQMLDKLFELQEEYRQKGLPTIDIGIGLNTGDMSVGNMGSDTVRSYTVMGDAVNLGSRLEGINKQYGTRIIISEFTYNAVKDTFICREVDWVKVKGKLQPVRIFELIAEGKTTPEKQQVIDNFNAGFNLYHERKFQEAIESFNKALAVDAEDECSKLYVERCQDYLKEPPPEDWDGVYTMTSK